MQPPTTSSHERKTRILIVEDDVDVREVVKSALLVLGHETLEAADGVEGLKVFNERSPELVIVDGRMPGMNGLELCAEIRKHKGPDMVPIVMLTAVERIEDKVKALEGGVNDYITKPFHHKELQARVAGLLRVRELQVRLAEKNTQLQEIQDIVLQQERQLVISQLAGTAAHQLGQPLAAILLNCYLLQSAKPGDAKYAKAVAAIEQDARVMSEMIEKLKTVDPTKVAAYYRDTQILDIE